MDTKRKGQVFFISALPGPYLPIFSNSNGKIVAVEYDMIGEGFPFTLYAGQEESLFIQIADRELDISQISDFELKIEYSKYYDT